MRVVVVGLGFSAEPAYPELAGRAAFAADVTAANWTATGIAAHESALRGGQRAAGPDFD